MKSSFNDYTRLAGSTGVRGSLWLGPDHLLAIEGHGLFFPYKEIYRRIDYKNIQALALAGTARYIWLSIVLFIPFALLTWAFVAILLTAELNPITVWLGCTDAIVTAWLIYHLVRGPTCRCVLQTAVSSVRLKCVTRKRMGRRVLAQLSAVCEQHQAGMPAVAPAWTAGQPVANPTMMFAGDKPFWEGSSFVGWTTLLTALWGLALAGQMFWGNLAYLVALILFGGAVLAMAIGSLARVLRFRGTGGLQGSLWGVIIDTLLTGFVFYVLFIVLVIQETADGKPDITFDSHSIGRLAAFRLQNAGGLAWLAWTILFLSAASVVLGVIGFPLSRNRIRHTYDEGSQTPGSQPPSQP